MTTETTTIVSTFDDHKIAGKAMDALRKEGIQERQMKILKGDADKLMRELAARGFDKDDARGFADAAGQGKTLVATEVSEAQADQTVSIMDRFETSQDEDDRDAEKDTKRKVSAADRQENLKIVEEQLAVGKSKFATGGVRVTSNVSERPIKKTINIREEHVGVERRPADRALNVDEANAAFEEKTVEMMGTTEEAEIHKEARVVGEVAITKEIKDREQTVRDTVRSTDVQVEEIKASPRKRK